MSEDINDDAAGTGEPAVPAGPAGQPSLARESNVRRINVKIYKWMLAASVALLLVSSYLAASFYTKWKSSSDRVLALRSEEHTSELQSLMRISYAVFCLKKKK